MATRTHSCFDLPPARSAKSKHGARFSSTPLAKVNEPSEQTNPARSFSKQDVRPHLLHHRPRGRPLRLRLRDPQESGAAQVELGQGLGIVQRVDQHPADEEHPGPDEGGGTRREGEGVRAPGLRRAPHAMGIRPAVASGKEVLDKMFNLSHNLVSLRFGCMAIRGDTNHRILTRRIRIICHFLGESEKIRIILIGFESFK